MEIRRCFQSIFFFWNGAKLSSTLSVSPRKLRCPFHLFHPQRIAAFDRVPWLETRPGDTQYGVNLVAVVGVGGRKREPRPLLSRLTHRPATQAGKVKKSSDALGGLAKVPMVQSSNHRFCTDRTELRRLNWSRPRTILRKSKMSARTVIVPEVLSQDSPQMPFVEDDHMIHTLSANRSNDSFNVGVLPGRSS